MISAHRGLWTSAPENSISAIRAAQDFDFIEIDTQLSRDGVPVVIHDPDLSRTVGKEMVVAREDHTTLISQYLLTGPGGSEAEISQETLPTLDAALRAARPSSYFDIDVKLPEQIEAVSQFLEKEHLQHRGSLKIDTKTISDIDYLLFLQKTYGVMVMAKIVLPEVGLDHVRDLVAAGVAAIEVWFDDLDQLREACDTAGNDTAISTFTLDPVHCCGLSDDRAATDPDAVWGKLLDVGVTIVMTDLAPTLISYLKKRA